MTWHARNRRPAEATVKYCRLRRTNKRQLDLTTYLGLNRNCKSAGADSLTNGPKLSCDAYKQIESRITIAFDNSALCSGENETMDAANCTPTTIEGCQYFSLDH